MSARKNPSPLRSVIHPFKVQGDCLSPTSRFRDEHDTTIQVLPNTDAFIVQPSFIGNLFDGLRSLSLKSGHIFLFFKNPHLVVYIYIYIYNLLNVFILGM